MAAEASKDKGNAAFKTGDLPLALAHYGTAMSQDPSIFTYPLNRALVYLKLDKFVEAEKDATTALNLMPDHPKALFRRGLARKGRGKLLEAEQDFQDALRAGAGDDVKRELEAIKAELGSTKAKRASQASTSPAPSSSSTCTAVPPQPASSAPSPSTSRLRAAISSTTPSTPPLNSKNTTADSDFMRPVSTRRLEKSPAAAPAPASGFAAKKQARDERIGSAATSYKTAKGSDSAPTRKPDATSAPVTEAPAPTLAVSSPSISATIPRTPASVTPPSVSLPKTAAALEQRLADPSFSPEAKLHMLQSLDPVTLPQLLGSSLTPDLLSSMLSSLAAANDEAYDSQGIPALLSALTRVPRFGSIVGFLDESEKRVIRNIIDQARARLTLLWSQWSL